MGEGMIFGCLSRTVLLFLPAFRCLALFGYQGILKLHANSQTPIKKPKGKSLDLNERRSNRDLACRRVIAEHVNRRLKIFRILAECYRNRRRRVGLRFNLIAGLYNYELTPHSSPKLVTI